MHAYKNQAVTVKNLTYLNIKNTKKGSNISSI